jgi:hypothetical protein
MSLVATRAEAVLSCQGDLKSWVLCCALGQQVVTTTRAHESLHVYLHRDGTMALRMHATFDVPDPDTELHATHVSI